jgi:hypothetical protein
VIKIAGGQRLVAEQKFEGFLPQGVEFLTKSARLLTSIIAHEMEKGGLSASRALAP